MRTYPKSKELFERACRVLAGGVSSEFRKFNRPYPLFYSHGRGSRLWDVDGNEYLDFALSQGPLILGHSCPEVLEAVATASAEGQLFAGLHLAELELAERLQRQIPGADLIRFSLSGSEAVQAALRVARAAAGRPKFLRFEGHYHGWLDNVCFGIAAPTLDALGEREAPHSLAWSEGLPQHAADESIMLPWNDLELLRSTVRHRREEIAAILMEPIMCNSGCIPPAPGYLEGAREICDRAGILLIFDQVIAGFRLGGSDSAGVVPDLAVFGKAMANGYPISALAGKREWMRLVADSRVIHAGTMNAGNPSVAAALATLTILERDGGPARLAALGARLMTGLRDAARAAGQTVPIQGPGAMFHMGFTERQEVQDYRDTFAYDKAKYAAFVLAMQDRGIRLIGRGLWYVSAAHTEGEIDRCVDAAKEALRELPG
jgi:glutamate-1-semialdehyde 2,1-aminomutase